MSRDLSIWFIALALAFVIALRIRETIHTGVVRFGFPLPWYAERNNNPVDYWVGVSFLAAALALFLGIAVKYFLAAVL